VSDAEEHLALEKELLAVREKLEKAEKEGANLAEIKTKHLQDEKDLESHLLSIHEAKNKVIQEQKNLSELSSGLTEASLLAKEEGNVKANENAYMDKLAEDGRTGLVRIDQKTGGIDIAAEEKRLEGHLRTETVRAEKNKGTEKGDKSSANVKKLQEELALLQKVKKAREEADKVQAKTSNTNKKVASSLASTLRGENQSVASQKAVQNALSATGLEQQEAIDLLNQAEQGYFQSEQAAEKYAKLIEELQKSTTAYNEELKELEKNLEATAKKTDQAANTQENLDNKIKDTNKSLNAQQLAQNITGIAGALTSLIGVIDAVSNISSIAKDEDLERGEKVKQIIVAILSILVAVIGVIPPLVTGVKFLGTETFFAGLKAQAGWLPYVAVILAIVAILALIIGLVLLFTRDTETGLEKANKALEKQKEDLAAVNEQYKKMQEELAAVRDSFDELAEKQKIINDLQVGTEEWTKAVQENNQAVMDLVSQYGELAGAVTVDSNGVMSITQEGQEQLEAKLQKQTNQAYANTLAQQANVMKAQQKVDSLEAGKAFGEGESYDFAENYDTEQLEKILVESKSI
jgi:uncharacterized membrane protein